MNAPSHQWHLDPRVAPLLARLADELPALNEYRDRLDRHMLGWSGPVADALNAIYEEYSERCFAYMELDYDTNKHVFEAIANGVTVNMLITHAIGGMQQYRSHEGIVDDAVAAMELARADRRIAA